MTISRFKKHLEAVKTMLDGPLHPAAQPLEIRRAVVDAIERKVEPIGAGRRVLPYNRLGIRLFAPPNIERPALAAAFSDLDARIRERLREVRCEPPEGFECTVTFVKKPPADWSDGQLFSIDYQHRGPAGPQQPLVSPLPTIRITVVKGTANRKAYSISDPVILIGRTGEVTDETGRVRRNHIAFTNATSTVSRAHARLRYTAATGEWRLLDEGSRRGTRVVRGATTIPVPRRDPRGVRILSGDEIQLGDACLRVVIG